MIGLTHQQRHALTYIRQRVGQTGVCPSYEEIGRHLGLASRSGVHRVVTALEDRGAIRRLKGQARSIEILGSDLGDISALNDRTTEHLLAMRERIDAILKGRGH